MILSALSTLAAYDYTVTTTKSYTTTSDVSSGTMMVVWILFLVLAVIMIASMWRIFTKAGRPGWAAIVPLYNTLQLIWTTGKPWWWILLLCIPFVNIIIMIVLYYNLAKAFGKGVGYTLLLILLPIIGFPMLAWGDATYRLPKPKTGR